LRRRLRDDGFFVYCCLQAFVPKRPKKSRDVPSSCRVDASVLALAHRIARNDGGLASVGDGGGRLQHIECVECVCLSLGWSEVAGSEASALRAVPMGAGRRLDAMGKPAVGLVGSTIAAFDSSCAREASSNTDVRSATRVRARDPRRSSCRPVPGRPTPAARVVRPRMDARPPIRARPTSGGPS
jgi:hypothetical protein